MNIIAIDATRRHGVISHSVETAAAAAEAAGATVERVKLYDLDVRSCTGCGMCKVTGYCKIDDDLPALVERIAESDGVIVGTPSYFRKPDEATSALLDRIGGYFARCGQLHLPGFGPHDVPRTSVARDTKRAIVITACATPEPLATFFGFTTGPVRHLRSALGSGGIRTIGSLAVTDTWRYPEIRGWEHEKACSLGRILAGKI